MTVLKLRLSIAFLLMAFATPVLAQPVVSLVHDSFWKIVGRQVSIEVATISNSGTEDSGPVFLSLYAQSGAAYDGGPPGILLARAPIGSIMAGQTVNNLAVTTRLHAVRTGLKFTALMIEQQNGRKYSILDWVSFTSTYSFPRGQNGGVGSDDSAIGRGDIAVTGAAISVTGRRATVDIAEVQNQRETDATGMLRMSVYSTTTPYSGGLIEGQLLATRVLGQVAPGDYYDNLHATMLLKPVRRRVPSFLTLVVEENQTGDTFTPVAWVAAQ